ncbi:MAG: ferrous iron transport protein A [Gammaproteobacteria bacterium]|nr:ferrous iron transport protein A [Gammaproteobacteria bacterium]
MDTLVLQSTQSLWDLPAGEKCQVQGFHLELDASYCLRLQELGFHPGQSVTCILAPSFGAPKLYRVHNSVYSLDDRVAKLIATSIETIQ